MLFVSACFPDEAGSTQKKSKFTAKLLALSAPAGGLGFMYLDRWNEDYGKGMLLTQSSLFASGVAFLALGFHLNRRQTSQSDVIVLPMNNYAGISALILLGAWTVTKHWEIGKIDGHFKVSGESLSLSVSF